MRVRRGGIIGGDGSKQPIGATEPDALDRFIHGNKGIALRLHVGDDRIEEIWRDVEVPIDAERLLRNGGHAMEHEDGADAADERPGETAQDPNTGPR